MTQWAAQVGKAGSYFCLLTMNEKHRDKNVTGDPLEKNVSQAFYRGLSWNSLDDKSGKYSPL